MATKPGVLGDTLQHSATGPGAVRETIPQTTSLPNNRNQDISDFPAEPEKQTSKVTRTPTQIALIMFSLCTSVFLAALDITIVTTALPTIASHFHSTAAYTWVGSAYMLANAGGTPLWGKLSDIWGRKPLLLVAIVVFFCGSTICGAAVSIDMLIAGRIIQGLGAGGLLNLVNIVVSDLFSMRERSKYYGFVGMTWALAGSTGPVLGGVLTQKASWRWCYYINLPLTGIAFFIILFVLKLYTPKTPMLAGLAAIDWLGSLAIAGATVMFLLGLTLGGISRPWDSPLVLCLIIFGLILFLIFGFIEWRFVRYPIMPMVLFRNTTNLAAYTGCFLHGALMILITYFLPLYFQSVLSTTVILSGVWILPLCLSMSLAAMITGRLISTSGAYLSIIRVAFSFAILGISLLTTLPHSRYWPKLIFYQFLIGFGIGPNFQTLLVAIQNQVPREDHSTATAAFGFMRNLATGIAVVAGNVIFQNTMQKQQPELNTILTPPETKLFAGKSAEASVFSVKLLGPEAQVVIREAFYASLRNIWILGACLAGGGVVISMFVKGKELSEVNEEVKTGIQEIEKGGETGRELDDEKEAS